MSKIDTLLKRAKRETGKWRPFMYTVTKSKEGMFRVVRTLWNGIAGSLSPSNASRISENPYSEKLYRSKKEAQKGIDTDVANFEQVHSIKLHLTPRVYDLCPLETDAEKKEHWRMQGGTVMEYLAEKSGLPLEDYIRKEFGPPQCSEHELNTKLAWYADIIRWRKEDGKDGEKAAETINTEGS